MAETIMLRGGSSESAVALSHASHDHTPPHYLAVHYWWAYIHPRAVRLFERQWLVNLILCGNYDRLRDSALVELGDAVGGTTLQVACVYGDLTSRLCRAARRNMRSPRVRLVAWKARTSCRSMAGTATRRFIPSFSLRIAPDRSYDPMAPKSPVNMAVPRRVATAPSRMGKNILARPNG